VREGIAPYSESGYAQRWIGWIWARLWNMKNSVANVLNQCGPGNSRRESKQYTLSNGDTSLLEGSNDL
jgi:hypothetical protein